VAVLLPKEQRDQVMKVMISLANDILKRLAANLSEGGRSFLASVPLVRPEV
jgi:hypothetical protein